MSTTKPKQKMSEAKNRVCKIIEDEKEEIVQTLRTLVQIPTGVGSERTGQRYIQELSSALNLKVVAFEASVTRSANIRHFQIQGWTIKVALTEDQAPLFPFSRWTTLKLRSFSNAPDSSSVGMFFIFQASL